MCNRSESIIRMDSDALHVLLLRHGQTDANQYGVIQGHSQTVLNELGQRQAALLARRLIDFRPRIQRLICSDLVRAQQTVGPIAAALNLEVHYDAAWRERAYGTFEGLTPDQCSALRQSLHLSEDDMPPGAQNRDDYIEQIRRTFLDLVARHRDAGCVGVVTHGGACRAIGTALAENRLPLDAECQRPMVQQTPNCAITHLVCTWRGADKIAQFRISCVNNVEHLSALASQSDSG